MWRKTQYVRDYSFGATFLIIKPLVSDRTCNVLLFFGTKLYSFWFSCSFHLESMSDDMDWEEWDSSSLSFGQHMIAGCIAGVSEHIAFFPIDTLRVLFLTPPH